MGSSYAFFSGRFENGHSLISSGLIFLNSSIREAGVNPFRVRAMEELAKHHEHRTKDYAQALELTRGALALESSAGLRKRAERLAKRAAKPKD